MGIGGDNENIFCILWGEGGESTRRMCAVQSETCTGKCQGYTVLYQMWPVQLCPIDGGGMGVVTEIAMTKFLDVKLGLEVLNLFLKPLGHARPKHVVGTSRL